MSALSDVLIVAGAALAMIGGIGAVRFRDLYSRMHAAAKAPTLGLVLVSIGAAIAIDTVLAYTTLLLVVILQLLSSPVGAHALSRASRRQTPVALDGPDHLTRDEAAASTGDHPAMSEPPE
jgi:multicomponent Na+:H+ antiporter subunit G